jgi:hypothetical protein
MPDGAPDPLAFLFTNPALSEATGGGVAAAPEPTSGADNFYTGGTTLDTSAPPSAAGTSGQVFTLSKQPNYVQQYDTGLSTMQQLLKHAYTPDDSEAVKERPQVKTAPSPEDTTIPPSPDTTNYPDQSYYNTREYLRHGQEVIDENDRVVGNAGKLDLGAGADSGGSGNWISGRGTEFGEVDNPVYGGYTEAGWNKGAWGDSLSGWDTEGVALPHTPYGTRVEVRNPKTGVSTITTVKDRGPGAETGAAIDLLGGTRTKLGFERNFSGPIEYRILNGSSTSAPASKTTFGHDGRDPNLQGAALPNSVIKNSIGDYENDPEIFNGIKNGDYQTAVTNEAGITKLVPIVHAGPADWTGHALHLTSRTAQDLGIGDKGKVGYQLVGPGGHTMPIKGYHPDTISRTNWDDHIGQNRKTAATEETQEPPVAGKLAGGKKFTYEKYNIPVEQGGYLKSDGTTDFAKANADKAADQTA